MKRLILVAGLLVSLPGITRAQEPKNVIEAASKETGGSNLKSIQYSGSGYNFAVGQSVRPNADWPKFTVKSYSRLINYETVTSREEMVRTQGENPPRGGGGQPMVGEQRQTQFVSGTNAWNLTGNNATPAPAAVAERLLQLWVTPHGFLKAATANHATVKARTVAGRKVNIVSFVGNGKFPISGVINDKGLVEKVETWLPNPVLGDMLIETTYTDYKDFNGVKFPARIVQKQGGFPALDLTIDAVQVNPPASLETPESVKQAGPQPSRVETQKLAEGVWYLTGSTHHSVAVEFKDHIVVVEGPLNEDRSKAVIAEVRRLVPGKPIKYLVNTHHHFDHSGGIRTYAAEDAIVITQELNKPYYDRLARAPRKLEPDSLALQKKALKLEVMKEKRVLTDGSRVMELHHIVGSSHNEGIIMAYLPKEKILIEADVFNPPPANAPPPTQPNPFTVNLYENLKRLNLAVDQIAALHVRLVTYNDMLKAIGKTP